MNELSKIVANSKVAARVKLALLGQAHAIEIEGQQVKIPRMGLILAAFLLLECSSMRSTREEVGRFLWEDLDKERQAGNLRQLLLRLRNIQTLHGMQLFSIHADHVALNLDGSEIDVVAFRTSTPANSEQKIAAMCEAYAGELLAGLHEHGEKLSQWLVAKRSLLRAEFVAAILPYLEDQHRPDLAPKIVAAKRLIEAEPFHEAGYRALMQAYADRGDVAIARRLYDKLERLLTRELGCKPSPQTRDLCQRLLDKRDAPMISAGQETVSTENEKGLAAPMIVTPKASQPRLAIVAPAAPGEPGSRQELADGFVDQLVTRLWQSRNFALTLPSSFSENAEVCAPPDIDYLIEVHQGRGRTGRVISARLLAMPEREILWAAGFDNSDEFANGVHTTVLSVIRQIENREIQLLETATEATSAYRLTVQGQRLLRCVDLPSIRRARNLFKTALALAPAHVPALTGVSRSYVMEWLVRAPYEKASLEIAEQSARKAISICPDDRRGHHALGLVKLYFKEIDESIETLVRATTLSPDDPDVRADLADALVFNGQAGEAIELYAPSNQDRRPGDYPHWILASAHFCRGDYRASLDEIAQMENPVPASRVSAAAHALLGETQRARRIVTASMEFNPEFNLNLWLSMFPCHNHEYIQRYSDGLREAGFK